MARFHSHHIHPRAMLNRIHFFFYSAAIIALLHRHIAAISLAATSSLLFLADLTLAFMWLLSQGFRWRPIIRQEFPHLLRQENHQLPALDVFICTADPIKEPPESVVSTALSAMAFDYPTDRLSVYVSDDGSSELTLFSFMEAAKFARYWLPFCRENNILERSPEAFFESGDAVGEARKMKKKTECKGKTVNVDNTPTLQEFDCFGGQDIEQQDSTIHTPPCDDSNDEYFVNLLFNFSSVPDVFKAL